MKNKISYYFTELSIVVLGVTIALVLGNLNEQRKANNKAQKSISLMINELKDHKHMLDRVMAFQDTVFKAMEDSSVYEDDYDLKIAKLGLNKGAYLFMVYNEVFEHIDFNLATDIMEYYSDLDDLLALENNLWIAVSENAKNPENKETLNMILFWSMQLYSFEEDLLRMNNELQNKLHKAIGVEDNNRIN